MLTDSENTEYNLLKLLTVTKEPTGSVMLSLILKNEQNISVSSATIGRMLARFDYDGITEKHGFKGRLLTETGLQRLEELESKKNIAELSTTFLESVDSRSKKDLIDVLIARRGLEQESARLAALNATGDDIEKLCSIYAKQVEEASNKVEHVDNDVMFHHAIGKASKNKVLVAAYDFIWQHGRFSPTMIYIRSTVGGTIAVDHGKILDAIVGRDPDKAAQCMYMHIDSLIKDVNKYWSLAN